MENRSTVEEVALIRKIPYLVHFTRAENIPSIMRDGLLPVSVARARGINPAINDNHRLDGRPNGTSVSIAFPNGSMFYRLRNENPGVDWVVLVLSKSVLWAKDALFCQHNAADSRISRVPADMLGQPEAFAQMFDEIDGHDSRIAQGLKEYDPTDVQGEVLLMQPVEPEFIIGAVFNNGATKGRFSSHFGQRKLVIHSDKKGFFANRTYHRNFGGR